MHDYRTGLPWALGFLVAGSVLSGCFESPRAAGHDLVSDDRYSKLLVEVDYAEGYKPRDEAVDLLRQRILQRLDKPGGTTFDLKAFAASDSSYSNDDLLRLESEKRDHEPGADTMVLYVLYLNGHHEADTSSAKVLGVKYGRGASIAVFKDTIDKSTGLLPVAFNQADIEKAVLVHEFGHALGLVNLGLEMQTNHEDPDHGGHSSNEDSVMYWAIENTSGLPLLDQIPNDFDENDKADIRAAGGK